MFTPASRADSSKKAHEHNAAKHPHAVQGERRAKHQTQNEGAAHTRHLMPEAKRSMHIIGSIRPPCVPKPMVEPLRPSKEAALDFVTYSPFDARFPASSSAVLAKAAVTAQRTSAPFTVATAKNKRVVAAAKPKTASVKASINGNRRLMKQHVHDVPRKLSNKSWHLAGWVTYSPFDSNFDRVCYGTVPVAAKKHNHRPHAHHAAGRPHHPGHHQAHHVGHDLSPAQRLIANFYSQQAPMPFPRMSPTNLADRTTATAPATGMSSFFMPAPRPALNPLAGASMAGLPGSMRAFAPQTSMRPNSSGFAW
jgi:hypothetical protein